MSLQKEVEIPNNVMISKAVNIQYFLNSLVNLYKNYGKKSISNKLEVSITLDELKNGVLTTSIGIIEPEKKVFNHYFDTFCLKINCFLIKKTIATKIVFWKK